jgi:site-specific recombinase XerD
MGFESWLSAECGHLGKGTRAVYARTARRWEDQDERPEEWLKKNLDSIDNARTFNGLNAAAKYWAEWKGYELPTFKLPRRLRNPPSNLRESLNDPELAAFYAALEEVDEPYATILELLPKTGFRISEMTGLKHTSLTQKGRHHGIEVVGKGEKTRWVPLSKSAQAVIKDYQDRENPKGLFLFPNPKDLRRPVTPASVRLHLREMRKALPGYAAKVTPHILRHTWATRAMQKGVGLKIIQTVLGHASIATTALYQHPSVSDLAEAMEATEI